MLLKGIIYKYTSPVGKVYIGQTTNEKSRKSSHKYQTPKTNTKFRRAIRKYGYENFEYEVLWAVTAEHETVTKLLNLKEIEYIANFNSFYKGLNSTKGGGSTLLQNPAITAENKVKRYKKYIKDYDNWFDDKIQFELEEAEYERKANIKNRK